MTFRTGLTAAAALSLSACGGMQMTDTAGETTRTGAGTAETACVTAVNTNMPGGRSSVVSSGLSDAGTLVMVRSADGTNWRCLASNNGVVEDLSVV